MTLPESNFTHEDLIAWAREHLPYWQQDALRRLIAQGELFPGDIDNFAELAKAGRPHAKEIGSTLIKVRNPASRQPAVSLLKIDEIARVNALAPGPIMFAPSGLTVVYGDNAAGKSGVARILKKACRAAEPGTAILPNVYEAETRTPAEALIFFSVNGEAREFRWIATGASHEELATIHVFDAACAGALVQKPNQISYTPEVLQVFRGLVKACDDVAAKLGAEKRSLGVRAPEITGILVDSPSAPAVAFRGLSRGTPVETVEAFCAFTPVDVARLAALNDALREDPLGRARALEERIDRIGALNGLLSDAAARLSDDALGEFANVCDAQSDAMKAAEAAREVFASNSELSDVGSDTWKALWEAARRYSASAAYPRDSFPVVGGDARCVLCQQVLDGEAKDRLASFEDFVTSDLQQRSDEARDRARDAREALNDLHLPRSSESAKLLGFERDSREYAALKRFIVVGKVRLRQAFLEARYPPLSELPDLSEVTNALESLAGTLREAANGESRRQMAQEVEELRDRQALSPLKEALLREVERLKAEALLEGRLSECDTGRITRKAREAARLIVTGRLRSAFTTNLSRVGFQTTGVEIALGPGERAVHPYEMKLMERPEVEPGRILSEGERTCVALAGFLAEIEATGNASAIVLDDPVTSLDHRYRDSVAERLVEEARNRQVIVLTHDIVFLYMLRKHAREMSVPCHELSLERGNKVHGVVKEGPPWVALPVDRRIKQLRDELRKAEKRLENEDREDYERRVEGVYKRLRETWERAVEERLLNEVVQRFSTDIQTRRMSALSDIRDEDVETVTREMSRCSNYIHDDPGAVNRSTPEPGIVREHIGTLERWLEQLESRRR